MTPENEDINLLRRRLLAGIPFIFAIAAFACSYAGNFYCNNIQFVPVLPREYHDHEDFYNLQGIRPKSYGLWMYKQQKFINLLNDELSYTEGCAGYGSDVEFDTNWKLARAFSIIAIIGAGFILLWQFAAPFLLFDALYWRWAMLIFGCIGACQGVTLLFVNSTACNENPVIGTDASITDLSIYPDQCSWDWGTKCSLCGTILYFTTVISMIFIPAPGTRPNERKLPMMVWDDDTGDDASSYDYDDEDDDDDSVDSFACDEYDYEAENAERNRISKESQANAGYGDFDMDPSVSGNKSDTSTERLYV